MSSKKVLVRELANLINGHAFQQSDWGADGYPIIRIQNLKNEETSFHYTTKTLEPKYYVSTGDILVAWAGSLGVYEWDKDFTGILNQHIFKVVFISDEIDKHYFKYLISIALKNLASQARGLGLKHLKRSQLENYEFNLPPLASQLRFVKLIRAIEAISTKRQQTIKLADEYLSTIFNVKFGDPYFNTHKLPTKKLREIVDPQKPIVYGIVQAGPHVEGGVPYIRTGDIKNGVKINPLKLLRTTKEIARKYSRSECQTGDLIISIRATVGSISIVPKELEGVNLTQGTARISPDISKIDRYYLLGLLSSLGGTALVKRFQKGSTFKEITLARLRDVRIPVASLNEQLEYANMFKAIEAFKNNLRRTAELYEELSQTFMYNALENSADKIDEVDALFEDEIKLELFLNTMLSGDYNSVEQYTLDVERLFQILDKTEEKNNLDGRNMKGVIQLSQNGKIHLISNKEYKYSV